MQPTLSSSPCFLPTQLLSPAHHSIQYPPKKDITDCCVLLWESRHWHIPMGWNFKANPVYQVSSSFFRASLSCSGNTWTTMPDVSSLLTAEGNYEMGLRFLMTHFHQMLPRLSRKRKGLHKDQYCPACPRDILLFFRMSTSLLFPLTVKAIQVDVKFSILQKCTD